MKEILEALLLFTGGELVVRSYAESPTLHRGRIEGFDIPDISTLSIRLKWCAEGVGGTVPDGSPDGMMPERYLASNRTVWEIQVPTDGVSAPRKEGLSIICFDYLKKIEFTLTPPGIGIQLDVNDVEDMRFVPEDEGCMSEKRLGYLDEEMRDTARMLNAIERMHSVAEKFSLYGNSSYGYKMKSSIEAFAGLLMDESIEEPDILDEMTFNAAVEQISKIITDLRSWDNEEDALVLQLALDALVSELSEPTEASIVEAMHAMFQTCYDIARVQGKTDLAERIKPYLSRGPEEEIEKAPLQALIAECKMLLQNN